MCMGGIDTHSFFLYYPLSLSTVTGLPCYCARFLDGIDVTPHHDECTLSNHTCEMDRGWCFARVSVTKSGSIIRRFGCIKPPNNNTLNFGLSCNIDGPISKTECCSEPYCNSNLSLSVPLPPSSSSSSQIPLPSATSSPQNAGNPPYKSLSTLHVLLAAEEMCV